MIAENGTSHEAVGDLDIGQPTERGYYGQAFRKRLVHKPPPSASHTINILLWGLNLVIGLMLMAFMGWQLYTIYLT